MAKTSTLKDFASIGGCSYHRILRNAVVRVRHYPRRFMSSSTVPMPAMPNLVTSRFVTFGERNAGSVGPKCKNYSVIRKSFSKLSVVFSGFHSSIAPGHYNKLSNRARFYSADYFVGECEYLIMCNFNLVSPCKRSRTFLNIFSSSWLREK